MPGWIEESVGYHTDDGNIFHNADDPDAAIITEGRKPCEQHTTARLALLSEHRSAHPRRPRGSQSSREKTWDENFQVRAEEPLGTDSHRTILCSIGEHISWDLFVCSYPTAIVSITACLAHTPKNCIQSGNFQFDIKSRSDFKILSARKLYKDDFPKIQASAYNRYSYFFSIYFVKCKWTLLELNFYQPYPSSWREWIMSKALCQKQNILGAIGPADSKIGPADSIPTFFRLIDR